MFLHAQRLLPSDVTNCILGCIHSPALSEDNPKVKHTH